MQRNKHHATEEITVGFKAEQRHAEWVHRAAAKQGLTAAAYQKKVMLEWAAADLGIPAAEVAAALAARPPSQRLVAEAARAAGITTQELTRQATHDLARAILAQARGRDAVISTPVSTVVAKHTSGTRLRKVGS